MPDLAVGVLPIWFIGLRRLRLGLQPLAVPGGSATPFNTLVHASCQGHASGRRRAIPPQCEGCAVSRRTSTSPNSASASLAAIAVARSTLSHSTM